MKKIALTLVTLTLLNAENLKMQIYKPVTSSCPASWLSEIEEIADPQIMSIADLKGLKYTIGMPREMYSCNTSIIDDYAFEGNVPPEAIKKFLKEKPKNTIGLSLPANQNDEEKKKVYIIFDDKSYKLYGIY